MRTVVVFDGAVEWAVSSAATSTALAFEAISLDATGTHELRLLLAGGEFFEPDR